MKKYIILLALFLATISGFSQTLEHNTAVELSGITETTQLDSLLVKDSNSLMKFVKYTNVVNKLTADLPFITADDLPPYLNPLPLSFGTNWISDLTYDVYATRYFIVDTYYSIAVQRVVLGDGDPTYDRFDLIVVDNAGLVSVIEGTPSASPAEPNYNAATQFPIKFVEVTAGATNIDSIDNIIVYRENLDLPNEWESWPTYIPNLYYTPTATYNDTTAPYQGSYNIKIGNTNPIPDLTFAKLNTVLAKDFVNLSFYVKLNEPLLYPTLSLKLSFSAANGIYSNYLTYLDISNYLDGSNLAWQKVVIPYSALNGYSNYVSSPNFYLVGFNIQWKSPTFYLIDNIEIQTDTSNTPNLPNTSITNTSDLVNDGADGVNPFVSANDVPTKTSDITNDGADGVNPFITANALPAATQPLSFSTVHLYGLTYSAEAPSYKITDTYYSAAINQVTLDASDATFDRIDLIVANTAGNIYKVTGTPSANPLPPDITHTLEYQLKWVLVPANATTPFGVVTEIIYEDDAGYPTEWNFYNRSFITSPGQTGIIYSGTKAFFDNAHIQFTAQPDQQFKFSEFEELSFFTRASPASVASVSLLFGLKDATSGLWRYATITNPLSYFNIATPQTWQQVKFNKALFTDQSDFVVSDIIFFITSNGATFYYDKVEIQLDVSAITPPIEGIPTKTSQLTNDGANGIDPFITAADIADKVEDAQVLTNVPAGALFTDTVYTLPFTNNSANWNSAYGWGNHAGLYETLDANILRIAAIGVSVQAYNANTAYKNIDNNFSVSQNITGNLNVTGTVTASNFVGTLAGTNTGDQNASQVAITDAGALTTITNVEDFLAENRIAINLNTPKVSFPGFTSLLADYSYTEPTHTFAELLAKPTTIGGYGITDFNSLFTTQFGTKSTTNLSEGINLYYNEARVSANSSVVANTTKIGLTSGSVGVTQLATSLKAVAPSTTTIIDWNLGIQYPIPMIANTTLTFSNYTVGKVITLKVTGNFTLTLPTTVKGDLTAFDGTLTNVIDIRCIDSTAPIFTAQIVNY